MTPSNSMAMNLVRRPARAASFIFRSVWAAFILLTVCLLWLVLFLLFLPFIILAEVFGLKKKFRDAEMPDLALAQSGDSPEVARLRAVEAHSTDRFIFVRRRDISKLFGCNTRNVQYRWSIFGGKLANLKSEFTELRAIDFGAVSLRDSYELSKLGFRVVSV